MNPRQMQKLMSQMGIKNVDVPAKRVVIEKSDGSQIVVSPASVVMVEMQGQQSFQVSGTVSEQASVSSPAGSAGVQGGEAPGANESSESDADLVAKEAGVSKEQAQLALDAAGGDIAQAIMNLQEGK